MKSKEKKNEKRKQKIKMKEEKYLREKNKLIKFKRMNCWYDESTYHKFLCTAY